MTGVQTCALPIYLEVNCCNLLILTAFVLSCTVWRIFQAVWANLTLEFLLNSSIETKLKIAFITLLLNSTASFWEVCHSLIGVVGFSHLYSTKFQSFFNWFQECFYHYFPISIIIPIKVRRNNKRMFVFHDSRDQGSAWDQKINNKRATCFNTTCLFLDPSKHNWINLVN